MGFLDDLNAAWDAIAYVRKVVPLGAVNQRSFFAGPTLDLRIGAPTFKGQEAESERGAIMVLNHVQNWMTDSWKKSHPNATKPEIFAASAAAAIRVRTATCGAQADVAYTYLTKVKATKKIAYMKLDNENKYRPSDHGFLVIGLAAAPATEKLFNVDDEPAWGAKEIIICDPWMNTAFLYTKPAWKRYWKNLMKMLFQAKYAAEQTFGVGEDYTQFDAEASYTMSCIHYQP